VAVCALEHFEVHLLSNHRPQGISTVLFTLPEDSNQRDIGSLAMVPEDPVLQMLLQISYYQGNQ